MKVSKELKNKSDPKGVRKNHYDYDIKHSVNVCCYIDYNKKGKKPLGVRQDKLTHYILKKNDRRFCRPCLCGSVTARVDRQR